MGRFRLLATVNSVAMDILLLGSGCWVSSSGVREQTLWVTLSCVGNDTTSHEDDEKSKGSTRRHETAHGLGIWGQSRGHSGHLST